MVIASIFPTDQMGPAHFDAIKHGLDHDLAGDNFIIFYGNQGKASLVTAAHGGKIVAAKTHVRRRGY